MSTNLTDQVVFYYPLILMNSPTLTAIQFNTGTGASTGALLRCGIYNDTNGKPSTVLVDFGTVPGTAGFSSITLSVSQALTPGRYWFAFCQQGAPTPNSINVNSNGGNVMLPTLLMDTASNAATNSKQFAAYTQTGVSGAFATAGTLTPRPANASNQYPILGLTF